MKTKLHYVLSIAILLSVFSSFGQKDFFQKVTPSNSSLLHSKTKNPRTLYEFNYNELSQTLSRSLEKNSNKNSSNIIISLPNIDGKLVQYRIIEASVMHPDLQAKYPEIRSYVGYSIGATPSTIRFSLSPYKGFTGIVLGKEKTITYKPIDKNPNQVSVQYKSDLIKVDGFECKTLNSFYEKNSKSISIKDADDSQKRTYDLALSVTGEYSAFHGGTLASVNAALTATLTNINAVFENDFNVSLQLVANNDAVIYLNAASDPYGNTSSNYNSELQTTLDAVILDANYDIGHLLSAVGSIDGNAGCIGCVCSSGIKGSGYTSDSAPGGFNFDIDLVAHELGHQFGANHTWTFDGNEGENVQMEPGSGSTIMGYAGITGPTDLQAHSDPYFHAISIQQITTYVKSTSCASIINTGNTTPTVNAGNDLILPTGTPFKLIGTGGDVDGDIITYCWEQFNENDAATTYPDANSNDSNSVLFRSFSPTTNNIRYFPNLSDLKFGVNATQWEKIPNVNRTAVFRLTVRDNKAGGANNAHDDMIVTFDSSYGPFEITTLNTPGIVWTSGTSETITWNVNNTASLSGASNVNILLSTNGGVTYTPIASNIPNNGSYTITVPSTPAPYCRIMIEPTNNNFFAINSEDFSIDYSLVEICNTYNSTDPNLPISIADNTATISETSILNITDTGVITDVNLTVNIDHTWPGDITMTLESPSNTSANILRAYSPCENEDVNIIATFDDDGVSFDCTTIGDGLTMKSPSLNLGTWANENLNGQWTLGLGDYGSKDTGNLNSWSITVCYKVATPLSTKNLDFTNFKIYPNPNRGEFNIELNSNLSSKISVEVFDLRGIKIYKNMFKNDGDFNEKINLNNAQSGMYILNVTDGVRKSTRKIIIE